MEEPLLATAYNCRKDQGASPVVVLVETETLLSSSSSSLSLLRWEVLVGEIKKVVYIAMPMMVTTVSQYLLRVISMMMIGHLGELSLSGAAVATSLTNVTGFSLLVGTSIIIYTRLLFDHLVCLPIFNFPEQKKNCFLFDNMQLFLFSPRKACHYFKNTCSLIFLLRY